MKFRKDNYLLLADYIENHKWFSDSRTDDDPSNTVPGSILRQDIDDSWYFDGGGDVLTWNR